MLLGGGFHRLLLLLFPFLTPLLAMVGVRGIGVFFFGELMGEHSESAAKTVWLQRAFDGCSSIFPFPKVHEPAFCELVN
ncbi:hypothetical protein BDY21DRAFT_127674 [Lineolata rhizophorae]|uniref:Uncharacterized protein n=1 Tax=Lineolata rhizophorae TaxID=578093 RepID=A0A6A6NP66_9PEZI|nr:hypothetical protein BDY21DRAFT_127674 [Lineolata rhizophorae]